jgi:hypothetical protein
MGLSCIFLIKKNRKIFSENYSEAGTADKREVVNYAHTT